MAVKIGTVKTFPNVIPDKAQALKVLEEAAEVFGADVMFFASDRRPKDVSVACWNRRDGDGR